jgi:hypothetical protein
MIVMIASNICISSQLLIMRQTKLWILQAHVLHNLIRPLCEEAIAVTVKIMKSLQKSWSKDFFKSILNPFWSIWIFKSLIQSAPLQKADRREIWR